MNESDISNMESFRSGIHHSLNASFNSNQVQHVDEGVSRIPQSPYSSSGLSLALRNVPPRPKSGLIAPRPLPTFDDENHVLKSKSNEPKKSWEKHFRSFLSKEKRKKNNLLHFNKLTHNSPGSRDNSLRSGKIFRNIFKSNKEKQKTDQRSSEVSTSFSSFHSSLPMPSNKSLDTTIRRGIEKKDIQHRSFESFAEFHTSDRYKNTNAVSSFENKTSYKLRRGYSIGYSVEDPPSAIPSFHTPPKESFTEDSLLTPPQIKTPTISPASDDLDLTLHTGRSIYSKDSEMRRSFTEFHSSNEYGKDSTSAYLGRNSSVHRNNLFLHLEKPGLANRIGLKKNQHLRQSISAVTMNPSLATMSLPNHMHPCNRLPSVTEGYLSTPNRILNPIEGVETWNDADDEINSGKLIAPAIFSMCPENVISLLTCDDKMNCNSTSALCFGKIVLGAALVARLPSRTLTSSFKYGWSSAYFVLRQNYLLEYACDAYENENEIRGYAHLQYCKVSPHPEFSNTLQLSIFDETGIAYPYQRTTMILIKVDSNDQRNLWVNSITKASNLTIDNLYEFYDKQNFDVIGEGGEKILGNGRYSTIYAARRRRKLDEDTIPAAESAENTYKKNNMTFESALKIIPKRLFWEHVRNGSERIDTLVRETTVQATLTAHANENQYDPPFLRIRGFFETRETVVLELELLEGTDLFQYILENGILEESETARIMRDIFEFLSLMAKLKIAHRDVKPANIFMCDKKRDGIQVKVGDYGMSTFAGSDGLIRGRCGTPGYVAPEIFSAGVNAGYRNKVDLFSAGVTLHVLLCGYEPFYGENDDELVSSNEKAEIEFLESDWAHVSSEAKDLVKKLMEIDPSQRISADDALKHPWMLNYAFSHTEPVDNFV